MRQEIHPLTSEEKPVNIWWFTGDHRTGGFEVFYFWNNGGKWGILMNPVRVHAIRASEINFTNRCGKWGDSGRWDRNSIPLPVRGSRLTYDDSLPAINLEDLKNKIADLYSKSLYELLTRGITTGPGGSQGGV